MLRTAYILFEFFFGTSAGGWSPETVGNSEGLECGPGRCRVRQCGPGRNCDHVIVHLCGPKFKKSSVLMCGPS